MKSKAPGPARAGAEGEYEAVGPAHIRPLPKNCNADLARKKVYENLGLELARRGEINVSQFVATFVDLPETVQVDLSQRLVDFTRLPMEVYEAAGAIRFPKRFIPLPGGRR